MTLKTPLRRGTVHTRESPRVAQVLHFRAGVYLNSKFVILTRQGPSPSTRPSAPIGGVQRIKEGGGG